MSTAKPLKPTAANVNRVLSEAGFQTSRTGYQSGIRAQKRYDDAVTLAYYIPIGGKRLDDSQIDTLFAKAIPLLREHGLAVIRVDNRNAIIQASEPRA